jgi:cytochrome c biogenesis protein
VKQHYQLVMRIGGGEGDDVVGIGVVGWLRWGWRQLTSMRTALILLFLLSLAAVPGSLVPQTSASEINVQNFHANHKLLAPLFDKLDMFDVYGSFWFSAIYILLFISLLGCIIPRTYQFVGVLRAKPPTATRCCASAASGSPARVTRSAPRRATCARSATCCSTSR